MNLGHGNPFLRRLPLKAVASCQPIAPIGLPREGTLKRGADYADFAQLVEFDFPQVLPVEYRACD
jgi:hypothetical protein